MRRETAWVMDSSFVSGKTFVKGSTIVPISSERGNRGLSKDEEDEREAKNEELIILFDTVNSLSETEVKFGSLQSIESQIGDLFYKFFSTDNKTLAQAIRADPNGKQILQLSDSIS